MLYLGSIAKMTTCFVVQAVGHCETGWRGYAICKHLQVLEQLKRDFIIKLAEKLCSAERNCKACGVPHVIHLKRIHGGAVEDMSLHKRTKFGIYQSNKTRMKCCHCSNLCVERVLALRAKVVSKCNWIAQILSLGSIDPYCNSPFFHCETMVLKIHLLSTCFFAQDTKIMKVKTFEVPSYKYFS